MNTFLLALIVCANQTCDLQSVYIVDKFQAPQMADARADCTTALDASGDQRLVCLTPEEIDDLMGLPGEPQTCPAPARTVFTL